MLSILEELLGRNWSNPSVRLGVPAMRVEELKFRPSLVPLVLYGGGLPIATGLASEGGGSLPSAAAANAVFAETLRSMTCSSMASCWSCCTLFSGFWLRPGLMTGKGFAAAEGGSSGGGGPPSISGHKAGSTLNTKSGLGAMSLSIAARASGSITKPAGKNPVSPSALRPYSHPCFTSSSSGESNISVASPRRSSKAWWSSGNSAPSKSQTAIATAMGENAKT
mmetsp:Transcript_9256/g.22275  ORF Transcript_9256/g.22275 Transcript_9256/m.22275 type:complete len:223 (-) Transcript_9256:22-690(-)